MQRKKFTPEEDNMLRRAVAKYGAKKWDMIAASVPGRSGRQCRDRYQNYLGPGIFYDEWTPEEEQLLVEQFTALGPQWSKISRSFKGRTGTALKNRWNYYVSRTVDAPMYEETSTPVESSSFDEDLELLREEEESARDEEESPVEKVFGSMADKETFELAMMEFCRFTDPLSEQETYMFF